MSGRKADQPEPCQISWQLYHYNCMLAARERVIGLRGDYLRSSNPRLAKAKGYRRAQAIELLFCDP